MTHRASRTRRLAAPLLAVPLALVGVAAAWQERGDTGPPVRADAEPGPAAGAVEGTVRLAVAAESAPPMLSPYARRRYRPPTPSAPQPGSPVNVVVYVLVDGAAAPPPADATIVQRDRSIIPHVTPIQRGGRVHFPNRDDVFHNLFSLSDARPFNLGRYPPGESRSETFPRAGVVRMFCDIHSEMGGTILVLDAWLFTRPGADGAYRIEGVPAGRHRVVAWHEAAGADTAWVTIGSDATARADFDLGARGG